MTSILGDGLPDDPELRDAIAAAMIDGGVVEDGPKWTGWQPQHLHRDNYGGYSAWPLPPLDKREIKHWLASEQIDPPLARLHDITFPAGWIDGPLVKPWFPDYFIRLIAMEVESPDLWAGPIYIDHPKGQPDRFFPCFIRRVADSRTGLYIEETWLPSWSPARGTELALRGMKPKTKTGDVSRVWKDGLLVLHAIPDRPGRKRRTEDGSSVIDNAAASYWQRIDRGDRHSQEDVAADLMCDVTTLQRHFKDAKEKWPPRRPTPFPPNH